MILMHLTRFVCNFSNLLTSDEARRVNIEIEIRLSQIASYNAIRIKEFTRLFELDSDSVIML